MNAVVENFKLVFRVDDAIKILVIGGTGTLSNAVVMQSLAKGYSVTVLNRGCSNDLLPNKVCKLRADFYNVKDICNSIGGCEYNVVLDFLSRTPCDINRVYPLFAPLCQQYVFISSACVFRRDKADFPIKENSPKPNRDWSYNIEKYESEQRLLELKKLYPQNVYTIIRPYITYNENRIPVGIAPEYKYHKTIIERIKAGKPMFVINSGTAMTTVTCVEDFAKGVVGLMMNEKAYNEDFNVVGDHVCTQYDLLVNVFNSIGIKPNIKEISLENCSKYLPNYAEMIKGDRALGALFDNTKLKNAVSDLCFSTTMEAELEKVIIYYSSGDFPIDYKYDAQLDFLLKKSRMTEQLCYTKYGKHDGKLLYTLYSTFSYQTASRLLRFFKLLKICK